MRALLFLAFTTFCALAMSQPLHDLDRYNVIWTSPSEDAAGSMPIGNGEVVLNVWVERSTGDILFYIARGDALSEISRILKLGRVRVHLDPNPFKGASDFVNRCLCIGARSA
jgi:alpha-L-fucosidase 2